jgi:plasmid stabilization system protein ParE
MRVRYTLRARRDLQSILRYIDERSPRGATRVKRAIQKTIGMIGEFPESGRRAGEQGTRVLPAGRYPYLIYWSIEAGEAWIVHIRDARRRPWTGTDRKGERDARQRFAGPDKPKMVICVEARKQT